MLVTLLTAWLIVRLWKQLGFDGKTGWLPLLFWTLIPAVTLNSHENMLAWGFGWQCFLIAEDFNFAKLFVGDGYDGHMTVFGQQCFDTPQMYVGILTAGTVAHIDGKLKHGESVAHQFFAEHGGGVTFPLCVGGKVEKYEYPHNTVLAETYVAHGSAISG